MARPRVSVSNPVAASYETVRNAGGHCRRWQMMKGEAHGNGTFEGYCSPGVV